MKVISLNTWGGKGGTDGLLSFFEKHQDTDVFCLQEIFDGGEEFRGMKAARFSLDHFDPELFVRIAATLPNHAAYFRPHFEDIFGLAMFVRKDLSVLEEGETSIYREKGFYSSENIGDQHRILQYVRLQDPACLIANVHGLWNGLGKGDSSDRLAQSERIRDFCALSQGPQVVLGDFNLRPDTESLRLIEECGFRNLVGEYDIASTRTSLYDSRESEPFADYAFVSSDIRVNEFKVLPEEVSDHAALYLDFDIA